VQCGGNARILLRSSEVLQNQSSGLAGFGESRMVVETTSLLGSAGYGGQVSGTASLVLNDGLLEGNRKGGLLLADEARGQVSGSALRRNGLHGVAVADGASAILVDNELSENARDGALLLGRGSSVLVRNRFCSNGRHGLFSGAHAQAVLEKNSASDNAGDGFLLEGHQPAAKRSMEQLPSLEETPGVTLVGEDGATLSLPFQPKPIEESMLLALLRHGRLSEMALGRAAKSRRVGGAIENLIDRLNKAGMPFLKHEGDGPEGNVYALKIDLARTRQPAGGRTQQAPQGRQIC